MDFNCAELLGFSHSFQLWGEIANYRDVRTLSIKGRILASGGEFISGVWSGMTPYFNFTGYENISINGYGLGTGRLISVSFGEGTDTVSKSYQASIELLQTGNLWNFTGSYYTGFYGTGANISTGPAFGPEDLYNPKYINSLQENFTFSTKKSGEYQYDRSLSMDIDKSYPGVPLTLFGEVKTKLFAQNNDLQILGAVYPSYYYSNPAVPITYESLTYDQINRKYAATQSFVFDTGNPWTWNYKHTLNHTKDGFVSVSENGDIRSTRLSGVSKVAYAKEGYAQISTGIFTRSNSFYQYYITGQPNNLYSGTCDPLVNSPTQKSLNINNLVGLISYNNSYTDNPAQKTGYIFSYQDEISADINGIVTVSENGQYKGLHADRTSGFSIIYTAYTGSFPQISGRVSGFYTGALGYFFDCATGRSINKVKTDETFREYFQELTYNHQFSDDRTVVNDANFYRISATYSDQKPVLQVGYFNIINDSEIAQRQAQSTLGVFTNKISVIGRPETTIAKYLSGAYTKVLTPTGVGVFLSDMSYGLVKNNNQFDLSMTYNYSEYPQQPDLLV